MASFVHSIKDNYKDWQTGQSAEIDKWFLMDSPGNIIMILLAYLLFVLKIGPAIMKNRQPMELRKTLILYNGAQVIFSVVLLWMSLQVEIPFSSMFSSSCSLKEDPSRKLKITFAEATWWYHIAKDTELLDTVFFVLRKRNRQITFLHVYHHTIMVLFTWFFLKYTPGEQAAIIGIINSSVHVVMYTYYMIAAMGPAYQKYIWWKKYMTIMQLTQFCIVILYLLLLSISKCGHSRSVTYFFIINTFIFLYMFLDFYRKSYTKSTKSLSNGTSHKSSTKNGSMYSSQPFVDDNEVYSRITKDVELLDRSAKINKKQ